MLRQAFHKPNWIFIPKLHVDDCFSLDISTFTTTSAPPEIQYFFSSGKFSKSCFYVLKAVLCCGKSRRKNISSNEQSALACQQCTQKCRQHQPTVGSECTSVHVMTCQMHLLIVQSIGAARVLARSLEYKDRSAASVRAHVRPPRVG